MHVLSFRPEVILYIYMASCLSVLVFNILYIFADKYKGRALEKRSLSFVGEISAQIERLKEGLKAANWYVRLNCAEALIYGLGISRLRLFDVENGRDRYAREIIRYVLEKEQIRQQEMKEGQVNV